MGWASSAKTLTLCHCPNSRQCLMDASSHECKKRETPSAWTRILAPDVSRTISLCSFAFARSTRPEAYPSSRSRRLKAPQSNYEIISVRRRQQRKRLSVQQFSVDQSCTFPQTVNRLSAAHYLSAYLGPHRWLLIRHVNYSHFLAPRARPRAEEKPRCLHGI